MKETLCLIDYWARQIEKGWATYRRARTRQDKRHARQWVSHCIKQARRYQKRYQG